VLSSLFDKVPNEARLLFMDCSDESMVDIAERAFVELDTSEIERSVASTCSVTDILLRVNPPAWYPAIILTVLLDTRARLTHEN